MTMSNEMWVVVYLDQEPLAFPATLIKEVVPWQALNPVPSSAVGVMGLVSLRGETLAVVDVLRMTGHGELNDPQFMLIVDFPESRIGLAVARVEGCAVLQPRRRRYQHGRRLRSGHGGKGRQALPADQPGRSGKPDRPAHRCRRAGARYLTPGAEHNAIPTAFLGLIQGVIGALGELLGFVLRARHQGADTGTDGDHR